jgi:Tol biopolymer transport system component
MLFAIAGCSSGGDSAPPPVPLTGSIALSANIDRQSNGTAGSIDCLEDGIAFIHVEARSGNTVVARDFSCEPPSVNMSGVPEGSITVRIEGRASRQAPALWTSSDRQVTTVKDGPPVQVGTLTLNRQFQAIQFSYEKGPPLLGGVLGVASNGTRFGEAIGTVYAVKNSAETGVNAANLLAISEKQVVDFVTDDPTSVYVGADGKIFTIKERAGTGTTIVGTYPSNGNSVQGQLASSGIGTTSLENLALAPLHTIVKIKAGEADFANGDHDAIDFKAVSTAGSPSMTLSHNCPAGLTCTFRTGLAQNGGTETSSVQATDTGADVHLRVVASTQSEPGPKLITVTGTSAGTSVSTLVSVLVFPPKDVSFPGTTNFSLAATPSQATITPGVTSEFVIDVVASTLVSPVSLSLQQCPSGVECSAISPSNVTPSQNPTANPPRFTVKVPSTAQPGAQLQPIKVTGVSAGVSQTIEIPLSVSARITVVSAANGATTIPQAYPCPPRTDDNQFGDCGSFGGSVSANGRFVPFSSHANLLVPNDSNGKEDQFLRDTATNETLLVSHAFGNLITPANGNNGCASTSADGRFVAFCSSATNLVSPPTTGNPNNDAPNGCENSDVRLSNQALHQIYIWDRNDRSIQRITSGVPNRNSCGKTAISADARYVLFNSYATNLGGGAVQAGRLNVFLRDRDTNSLELISRGANGQAANDNSENPSITADGRYVVFDSCASNIPVPGGYVDLTNPPPPARCNSHVFRLDRLTGSYEIVSRRSQGGTNIDGDNNSARPRITPHSRIPNSDAFYVVYESTAGNLDSSRPDNNSVHDILVWDSRTKQTTRVSINPNGTDHSQDITNGELSDDGQIVAFDTQEPLVPADTNGRSDIYLKNLWLNTLVPLSVTGFDASPADRGSRFPTLSADGGIITFTSFANNLVSGDNNNQIEGFLVQRK